MADAIANPIGGPPLAELAIPGSRVAILVSDVTRPSPTRALLPPVLSVLARSGVRDRDETIVFALGIHCPHRPEEQPPARIRRPRLNRNSGGVGGARWLVLARPRGGVADPTRWRPHVRYGLGTVFLEETGPPGERGALSKLISAQTAAGGAESWWCRVRALPHAAGGAFCRGSCAVRWVGDRCPGEGANSAGPKG